MWQFAEEVVTLPISDAICMDASQADLAAAGSLWVSMGNDCMQLSSIWAQ